MQVPSKGVIALPPTTIEIVDLNSDIKDHLRDVEIGLFEQQEGQAVEQSQLLDDELPTTRLPRTPESTSPTVRSGRIPLPSCPSSWCRYAALQLGSQLQRATLRLSLRLALHRPWTARPVLSVVRCLV